MISLTYCPRGGLSLLTCVLASGLLAGCSTVSEDASGDPASGFADSDAGDGDGDGDWSTSGEGDDGAGSTTGGSSYDLPDPGVGDRPCDPWAQDCPDDHKCAYFHDQEDGVVDTRCVAVAEFPRGPGETCQAAPGYTGEDDCGLGLVCSFLDESNEGICMEMCGGQPVEPTCSGDGVCQVCPDDICPSICLISCDPLMPECPEGMSCGPGPDAFTCAMDASGDSPGTQGGPCEYLNECGAGSTCIEADLMPSCESGFCCAAYCELGSPEACEQGLECIPYSEIDAALGPDYPQLGVCVG